MDLNLEEGERKKAVLRLRKIPRQSIDAALNGSLADLEAISRHINLIPRSQTDATLEMYCHHLNEDTSELSPRTQILLAYQSLVGIGEMAPRLWNASATLSGIFVRNWTKIACCLTRSFDMLDKGTKEGRREIIDVASQILYIVCKMEDGLRMQMFIDPHGTRAIASCSIRAFGYTGPRSTMHMPAVLRYVLTNPDCRAPVLEALVEEAGGTDGLARAAVKYVRTAQALEDRTKAIAESIGVVADLYIKDVPKFLPFLRKRGLIELSKAMRALLVEDRFLKQESTRAAFSCYSGTIPNVFFVANASPWISQLIQQDVLSICVSSCISSAVQLLHIRTAHGSVKLFLSGMTPIHLVRYRIVGVASAALRRIALAALQCDVDKSSLQNDWAILERIVLERWILRQQFDASEGRRVCSNCGAAHAQHPLKKCLGCNTALYCSRKCQSLAWKANGAGHREECGGLANAFKSGTGHLNNRDQRFLEHIAKHDIARHLPGLHALAERKYPACPIRGLILTISYELYPPTFDIVDAEPQDANDDSEKANLMVRVTFMDGERSETHTFATELSTFEGVELPVNQATSASLPTDFGGTSTSRGRLAGRDMQNNWLQTAPDDVDEVISRLESRWEASDHWFSRCPNQIDETIADVLSLMDHKEQE